MRKSTRRAKKAWKRGIQESKRSNNLVKGHHDWRGWSWLSHAWFRAQTSKRVLEQAREMLRTAPIEP